jgi:hypothetical protein
VKKTAPSAAGDWTNYAVAERGRRFKKLAARRYAASLMSNAKWRKLFCCIDQPELGVRQCIFKFVGNDQERQMRTPNRRAVSYWSSGIVDSVEVGPIPFRAIDTP